MELPKYCYVCNTPCGGVELPAAWAVHNEQGSFWLCEKHYDELVLSPQRVNTTIYAEKMYRYTKNKWENRKVGK